MKYLKILILFVFLYVSSYTKIVHAQMISKDEIALSALASKKFGEKIYSGKITDLYKEDVDAEVKKNLSQKDFVTFLEKIDQTLGVRKKAYYSIIKK